MRDNFKEFLIAYAKKKNLIVSTYSPHSGECTCHLSRLTDTGEPFKPIIAYADGEDRAIAMAILTYLDPSCDFLPEKL